MVLASFALVSPAYAGQQSSSLTFSTTSQNIWGVGDATSPSVDEFLGFEWDVPKTKIIDIGTATKGNNGFEVSADFEGRVGAQFNLSFQGGEVNATLPYDAGFGFNRAEFEQGSTPLISTFALLGDNASFNTLSPRIQLFSDLIFEIRAGIQGTACYDIFIASDCAGFNESLLNINEAIELFAVNRDNDSMVRLVKSAEGDKTIDYSDGVKEIFPNASEVTSTSLTGKFPSIFSTTIIPEKSVTLEAKFPDVATIGSVDAGGSSLSGSESDTFVELYLDVDNIVKQILKKPKSGFGGRVVVEDVSGHFVLDTELQVLDIDFDPSLALEQSFSLTPTLMVSLDFNQVVDVSTNGGTTFQTIALGDTLDLAVGENFNIRWDDTAPPLEIIPTYSLTASFGNETKLDIDFAANARFMEIAISASAFGEDLFNVEPGPLIELSCPNGTCVLSDLLDLGLGLDPFDFPDVAPIELLNLDFLLGGFQNLLGDVLILENKDAVWHGEFDGNLRDDWNVDHAWREQLKGNDDRNVVLDIQSVRDRHNTPALASTEIVIQNDDTFTINNLSISEGVTLELLNGQLKQNILASRFDNQGTVEVLSNGILDIGADLTGGGTIKIRGGEINVDTDIGGVANVLAQTVEGYGTIDLFDILEVDDESILAADGGTLTLNGTTIQNSRLLARTGSTLRINRRISGLDVFATVRGGELVSEGSGVVRSSRLTLDENVVNSADLRIDDILRIRGFNDPTQVDFTNRGTVNATEINILHHVDGVEVGGAGTVTFSQALSRLGSESEYPALIIGSEQIWQGAGVVTDLQITNRGVFQYDTGGALNMQPASFDNEGVLSANGGNLNLLAGNYNLRNGTVKSDGGTIIFADDAVIDSINGESPGRLWDARSGEIRFENSAEQWSGLKANRTLNDAEVWLAPGGKLTLDYDAGIFGSTYADLGQFIRSVGVNGILRILEGRDYRPNNFSSFTPTVTGIDLEGLIELDGGHLQLTKLGSISLPVSLGTLDILAGGHFTGFGRLQANVVNNGLMEVANGELTIDGTVEGAGEYLVRDGGILTIENCGTLPGFCDIFGTGSGSTALSNAGITVDATNQATTFGINAELNSFNGTTVKLRGQNSNFTVSDCDLFGLNCVSATLEETLFSVDDSRLEISDGRTFNAHRSVALNGDSLLLLDEATYQSTQGLTINDTSAVRLNDSTLDLGGIMTINTSPAITALTGSGIVRASIDSAGLIDIRGESIRFENSTIDQTRGGVIQVGEIPNSRLGVLEMSGVSISGGTLSILDGGIVVGTGDLANVDVDVNGAILADKGDHLTISGGSLDNFSVVRAQVGGQLNFENLTVNNANGVLEINATDNPGATDSVLSLANATLSGGALDLISVPLGIFTTDSAAVLRGYGDIVGVAVTLDRFARIEAGAGTPTQTLSIDLAGLSLLNLGALTTAEQGGTLKLANGEITGGGLIEARSGGRVELQNVTSRNAIFNTVGDGVIVDIAQSSFANLTNKAEFDVRGHATFTNFLNNKNGTVSVSGSGIVSAPDLEFFGGTLNVSDDGLANLGGTSLSSVTIALDGNGRVNILDGSTTLSGVNVTGGTVRLFSGGIANLTDSTTSGVSFSFDAGAQLNLLQGSSITIDELNVQNGSVRIERLAQVQANVIDVGAIARVTLDGGKITAGEIRSTPGAFDFQSGTLALTGSDLVIGNGGAFGAAFELTTAQHLEVTQNVTIDVGAVLNLAANTLSAAAISNRGELQIGALKVAADVGMIHNIGRITGAGRIGATLDNQATGDVQAVSGAALRFTANANANAGQINVDEGVVEFSGTLTNQAGGFIGGAGLLATGGLANAGRIEFTRDSDVLGDIDNLPGGQIIASGHSTLTLFDDVQHNGAEIRAESGSSIVILGSLNGGGAFSGGGEFFLEGDTRPGNSPGRLEFNGNVTFGSLNTIEMELGGVTRGTEYDAIDVSGALTLGGTLNVVLFDFGDGLFNPQLGNSFDLFDAGSIIGSFAGINLPGLQGGLAWNTALLDTTGVLSVAAVPLPASVWMLMTCVAFLARRTRAFTWAARQPRP